MSQSSEPETSGLETRSKALFDHSVEQLDARTRSRLTQARRAALEKLQRSHGPRARWWAPAGGLAAAAALAIFVFGRSGMDPTGAPPLEELEAVAAVENIELLEDVEFYAWLAEQSQPAPGANRG